MKKRVWGFALGGLLISILLAVFVSPLASKAPDGLEKHAQDKGFAAKNDGAGRRLAVMPDYTVKGVRSESLSTALAGLAGTLAVFGIALGAAKLISRKGSTGTEQQKRI